MTHWSEGYAAEADYVAHYTPELNPLRAPLLLAQAGFAPGARPLRACELGFGLGVSTVVHAGATPVEWWGTDFSPSQALFARELARAGDVPIRLFDDSFAEFCARDDLPEFDFVALHGVWSWISEANRALIADFLRRRLRVGGVLYISYNAEPGWSQMMPIRNLMRLHVERMQAPGAGALAQAEAAQAFAEQLLKDNPHMAAAYPLASGSVEGMKKLGPRYISHEYLNRDWAPMGFAELARRLDSAKLGFACSATPSQHFDLHFLTADQHRQLAALPDPTLRESVRDFMLNRRFRKDYWIKGGLRPAADAVYAAQLQERLVLARTRTNAALTVAEAVHFPQLAAELAEPLLDLMADHRPRRLGDMVRALSPALPAADVVRAAMVLAGSDTLACAQDEESAAAARPTAQRLNRALIARAAQAGAGDLPLLASPVTGGAIAVPAFQLQMLAARAAGGKTPQDWARAVWAPYRDKGLVLTRDGKPLVTEDENLAYLDELATAFAAAELPTLKALACVD